jgi:DNA invertase Pin-like site-specific DNA recombinase
MSAASIYMIVRVSECVKCEYINLLGFAGFKSVSHPTTISKSESARRLLAGGVPVKDVAKNLEVSVPTLYRWLPASS